MKKKQSHWTADLATDPQNDDAFYIELLDCNEFKGRITFRDSELLLTIYQSEEDVVIPVHWLRELLEKAEQDPSIGT
jgi:hypothetical protein